MRRIVMSGIPRSGSTLVWQVLSELFDQDIPQIHPAEWEPDGSSVAVVTVRDPRDVAASLYRVRISRGGPEIGGPEGLGNVLHQLVRHFQAVPRIMRGSHVLLRYEEFFEDWTVIWNAILRKFGRRVHPRDRERIQEKFSVKANWERAAKLKDFNEVGEYQIHGDHIGPVAPGSWRMSLPEWGWERMRTVCDPIARGWGYED